MTDDRMRDVGRWFLGAALLVAAFFVGIFPGNIAQFVEGTDAFGLDSDTGRFVRLLFQPVLVAWALWSTGAWRAWRDRRPADQPPSRPSSVCMAGPGRPTEGRRRLRARVAKTMNGVCSVATIPDTDMIATGSRITAMTTRRAGCGR